MALTPIIYDDAPAVAHVRRLAALETLSAPVRTISGTTHTCDADDLDAHLRCTNGSAVAMTIPPNASVAYPVNAVIEFEQAGAGQVTLVAGAGVTLNSRGGLLASAGQFAVLFAKKVATNTWTVGGDLA